MNDENLRVGYALNCKNAKCLYNRGVEKQKLLITYRNLTKTSKEGSNGL